MYHHPIWGLDDLARALLQAAARCALRCNSISFLDVDSRSSLSWPTNVPNLFCYGLPRRGPWRPRKLSTGSNTPIPTSKSTWSGPFGWKDWPSWVPPVPRNEGICEDAHVSPNFLVILLREFSASVAWPVSCEDGTSDCIIRESVGTNANNQYTGQGHARNESGSDKRRSFVGITPWRPNRHSGAIWNWNISNIADSRRLGGPRSFQPRSLMGASAFDVSMPEWRRRIALVPQNRPSLDGTPRDFYQQVCQYHSQQQQQNHLNLGNGRRKKQDPAMLAAEWSLAASYFDQPWSTLSGGESQRASLAIALALEPDVLLLDECTSALDEQATLQVESTLSRLGIPVVMVSHDSAQVDRLCNRRIDLGENLCK
jgi:ABC-type iron transport system FetAB ATPase subunit